MNNDILLTVKKKIGIKIFCKTKNKQKKMQWNKENQ